MPEPDISWTRPPDPGTGIVHCRGDLDMATAPVLLRAVHTAVAESSSVVNRLVFDLGDVSFIDTGGVRALARSQDAARCRGLAVVLVNPSRQVRRVLDLTRMATDFDVRDAAPPGWDATVSAA